MSSSTKRQPFGAVVPCAFMHTIFHQLFMSWEGSHFNGQRGHHPILNFQLLPKHKKLIAHENAGIQLQQKVMKSMSYAKQ